MLKINLYKEMLKRAQLNQNTEPKSVEEPQSSPDGEVNPYIEPVSKIRNGEAEWTKPVDTKTEVMKAINKAKAAVSGMTLTNNNRKAVEALADGIEKVI